jgi:hypothetical protein
MKVAAIAIGLLALAGMQPAAAQSQPSGGSAFTATPPGAVMPSMTPSPTMGATAQPAPANPANAAGPAVTAPPQIIVVPRHHHHHRRAPRRVIRR